MTQTKLEEALLKVTDFVKDDEEALRCFRVLEKHVSALQQELDRQKSRAERFRAVAEAAVSYVASSNLLKTEINRFGEL